ncbi:hypothetical protein SAMN05444858_13331 [Micromonospora avicenniae]|uniref:Uncharacterized protein n=1 Tax=Micromonospora avicenniae TaxID=1198245 RepID=A0A1N7FBX7_9ACTN|nr:hypothetical protein SAMN05444858_13331 [Micromonospora avicenniae]
MPQQSPAEFVRCLSHRPGASVGEIIARNDRRPGVGVLTAALRGGGGARLRDYFARFWVRVRPYSARAWNAAFGVHEPSGSTRTIPRAARS